VWRRPAGDGPPQPRAPLDGHGAAAEPHRHRPEARLSPATRWEGGFERCPVGAHSDPPIFVEMKILEVLQVARLHGLAEPYVADDVRANLPPLTAPGESRRRALAGDNFFIQINDSIVPLRILIFSRIHPKPFHGLVASCMEGGGRNFATRISLHSFAFSLVMALPASCPHHASPKLNAYYLLWKLM